MFKRTAIVVPCCLMLVVCGASWTAYASGQMGRGAGPSQVDQQQERQPFEYHVVPGVRHGVSFFQQERHAEVEYEIGDTLTFDRFHTTEVMYGWLQRWVEQYPELLELYKVGESFGGQKILQVTVTNQSTGPATEKPAAYFEGGRHSGEVTSSESALMLLQHLLEGYGSDAEITELLDTSAIYIRVQNNPDGGGMYLHTAQRNRSSVRPTDNDGDGLLDEDPGNDLDGDGVIRQMRWQPTDGSGDMVVDERDPSGRLLRRAEEGETGIWRVATEGIDDDGDGRRDEDGIGGLDLHRNYAENWRPDTGRDRTGRGFTQSGAGAYPLSEPETRSVVVWLLENPNVSVANSMDTTVPMHLRPPSTSRSEERMYPEDLAFYEYFDELGKQVSGYERAGDVYWDYGTGGGAVNPRTGEPRRPRPLFGHGPDFGYWYYGAIWYGDELWNGGRMPDLNGDDESDSLDQLWWVDNEHQGPGVVFQEWTAVAHPELGEVEVGGLHPKFFRQNPPPQLLEEWARKQMLFNMQLALHLPHLQIDAVDVAESGSAESEDDSAEYAPGAEYTVTVRYSNTGKLPSALRQADLVKIVREDALRLEFEDSALLRGDDPMVKIIEPGVSFKDIEMGHIQPGESLEGTFRVWVSVDYPGEPISGTVHLVSTRGGHVRAPFEIR